MDHSGSGAGSVPRQRRATEDFAEDVADRLVAHVEGCLRGLEERTASPAQERLEYVAGCAAAAWGAPGWWVGAVEGERLLTRRLAWTAGRPPGSGARSRAVAGVPVLPVVGITGVEAGAVPPGPLDRALEGGSCVLRPGDGSGLADRLPEVGVAAAVAAGGYDHDARQWLVAVLLEEGGADAAIARLALTSLVQAALLLPVAVRRR